ncbi:NADH-quinone oxidoreductase subunit NuoK [Candidatus Sumerlaeota bacterium]|nr:NADH-quinone oxidoreductase subunit NuoK [Candidatus Sumerlaeota bacterium]
MEILFQGNLLLAAIIFSIGAFGFLWKQDAIGLFLCVELMLNASNLAFVSFAQAMGRPEGIAAFIFILTVAAAEAGVGLALFIKVFGEKNNIEADEMDMLRD